MQRILDKHSVSSTAVLANYWKNEARKKCNWQGEMVQVPGDRANDLFKDDYMPLFITGDVKREAHELLEMPMWLPLATRTRFFRATISREISSQKGMQVILLGSGFDTLAVRKKKYTTEQEAQFFEVDIPSVLACKREILNLHQIDPNATYIPCDYIKEDLLTALKVNGVDFNKPSMILWEGNTFYLERDEVKYILLLLARAFRNLKISFDFMHPSMKDNTASLDEKGQAHSLKKTLTLFARKKAPFKAFFSLPEIIEFCANIGLHPIEHKTAADLALEYHVDQRPYYTSRPYWVATFSKNG